MKHVRRVASYILRSIPGIYMTHMMYTRYHATKIDTEIHTFILGVHITRINMKI